MLQPSLVCPHDRVLVLIVACGDGFCRRETETQMPQMTQLAQIGACVRDENRLESTGYPLGRVSVLTRRAAPRECVPARESAMNPALATTARVGSRFVRRHQRAWRATPMWRIHHRAWGCYGLSGYCHSVMARPTAGDGGASCGTATRRSALQAMRATAATSSAVTALQKSAIHLFLPQHSTLLPPRAP